MYAKIIKYEDAQGNVIATIASSIADLGDSSMTYYPLAQFADDLEIVNGEIVVIAGRAAELNFAKTKTAAYAEIDRLHADYLSKSSGGATQAERDTWGGKAALAKLILAGAPITADGEAYLTAAGIEDRAAWASKVVAKSTAYFAAVGRADALRKSHKMSIFAAQNQADLDALMATVRLGWESLGKNT